MTYAPRRLLDLRSYLQDHTGLPAVSLGIIGSQGHHATGTSYHIGWSSLRTGAYSRQHPRDTKLKTDAASATDTGSFNRGGKTLVGLTEWAVAEARAGRRPDTRELIGPWSDGRAYRWAAENGWKAQLRARGDSHETHLHESWYRDSEGSDKIRYYRGYFEEDDMSWDETWEKIHLPGQRTSARGAVRWIHKHVSDSVGREEKILANQAAILAAVAGHDVADAVRAQLAEHRETLLGELTEDLADRVADRLSDVPAEQVRAAVREEGAALLARTRLAVDSDEPA